MRLFSRTESRDRGQAERAGRIAEWFAVCFLRLKGYRLLARRLRTPAGEIDLLMRRGGLVIVVEVKHRATHGEALVTINSRQRRRLERAGSWALAKFAPHGTASLRFDAVVVDKRFRLRHVRDAWRS